MAPKACENAPTDCLSIISGFAHATNIRKGFFTLPYASCASNCSFFTYSEPLWSSSPCRIRAGTVIAAQVLGEVDLRKLSHARILAEAASHGPRPECSKTREKRSKNNALAAAYGMSDLSEMLGALSTESRDC